MSLQIVPDVTVSLLDRKDRNITDNLNENNNNDYALKS